MNRKPDTAAEEEMVRIRAWQHILNETLKSAPFRMPVHLAFGYEGLAVALARTIFPEDRIVLHHRKIAYQLALLRDLRPIYDEFSGLLTGAAHGRLGSMNLASHGSPVAYTTSILGNGLPVATGIALNQKYQAQPGAVFVVIGDGGIEEGACYESLVFASSHKLRLVVILENNNQSMSSTIEQRRCSIAWDGFAQSLGIPYFSADGASLESCAQALSLARLQADPLPTLVEVALHAFNQHAGPSPGWPNDPKTISVDNGPFLEPPDRDPLHVQRTLSHGTMEDVFSRTIFEWKGRVAS